MNFHPLVDDWPAQREALRRVATHVLAQARFRHDRLFDLMPLPGGFGTLDELAEGSFQRVIPDAEADPAKVERVLLTSGKLYYELEERREAEGRDDVALVRMEQFYPLCLPDLEQLLAPYPTGVPVAWVQEEPENMGAWRFLHARFCKGLPREARVSTAPGAAFGRTGEAHMRLSFCVPEEMIHLAFDRMEAHFGIQG